MQTRTHSSHATHHVRSRRLPYLGMLAPLALLALTMLAAPAVALAATPAPPNLISADPATDAVVSQVTSVKLTFSENLARSGNNVAVYDARGHVVSTGPVAVKDDTLTVRIRPDGDGSYLVLWHAASATGGKPSIGAYTFAIGVAGNPAGEVGSTSALVTTSGGISPWWAVLTAIVGLIAGVLGASRIRDAGTQLTRRAQALRNRQPSRTTGQSRTPWQR